MEYLFPIPTIYEIINYNLANVSFNVVSSMEKSLLKYEKQFNKIYYFHKLLLLIIVFLLLSRL